MEQKHSLYIVGIVGIVAVVALIILTLGGRSNSTTETDPAGQAYYMPPSYATGYVAAHGTCITPWKYNYSIYTPAYKVSGSNCATPTQLNSGLTSQCNGTVYRIQYNSTCRIVRAEI